MDEVEKEDIMDIKEEIKLKEKICGDLEELKVWEKMKEDRDNF